MRRLVAFIAVGVVLAAGVVCAVMLRAHDIHGTPWVATTVVLIAAGAVGALVLAIIHAYHLESRQARRSAARPRRSGSGSPDHNGG
ncbi:MAG: hypothetical protein QOI06_291 [Nocardioidaceae bacterium]|jgi:NADH:ubiquinone oxidoreductase subunit 6 (subunit J)|nr:hypothetical protein [Nocardioidaceae bacterium]